MAAGIMAATVVGAIAHTRLPSQGSLVRVFCARHSGMDVWSK